MLEGGRISSRQFFWLIASIIITVSTFRLPHLVFRLARQDFWLAVIIAVALDLTVGVVLFILGNRYPGRTLFQYSQEILGSLPGKLAGLAYILLFLQVASLLVRSLSESLLIVMPETPIGVFNVMMIFLAGLATYQGLEVIGRMGELVGVVVFFLAGIVPLLVMDKMDWGNLLPLFQTSPAAIIKAGFLMTGFFGVCVVMGVFMAYHNQPREALKVKASAVIVSSLLMLVAYGAALAIYGQTLFTIVIHVSYNVARLISIRGFFERVEALIMTLWVLGGFLSIAIVYYCAALGTAQIFHLKSYRPLVSWLGAVILVASWWQFPSGVAVEFFVSHIFIWLALAVEAGLTGLLLLVSWFRKPA